MIEREHSARAGLDAGTSRHAVGDGRARPYASECLHDRAVGAAADVACLGPLLVTILRRVRRLAQRLVPATGARFCGAFASWLAVGRIAKPPMRAHARARAQTGRLACWYQILPRIRVVGSGTTTAMGRVVQTTTVAFEHADRGRPALVELVRPTATAAGALAFPILDARHLGLGWQLHRVGRSGRQLHRVHMPARPSSQLARAVALHRPLSLARHPAADPVPADHHAGLSLRTVRLGRLSRPRPRVLRHALPAVPGRRTRPLAPLAIAEVTLPSAARSPGSGSSTTWRTSSVALSRRQMPVRRVPSTAVPVKYTWRASTLSRPIEARRIGRASPPAFGMRTRFGVSTA